MERRTGMERGAGMRDIADCLTLRRLRGGVKIRASEFLGGGEMPAIIGNSPPPATASRNFPLTREEIPAFAGMEKGGRRRVRILFLSKKNFHSRPFFHSGESRNLCGDSRIRRRRTMQCSASRKILAVARMRFRLSPEWKILFSAVRFSPFSIPAKAGISLFLGRATHGLHRLCFGIRFGLGFKIGVGGGRGGRSWRFVPVGN